MAKYKIFTIGFMLFILAIRCGEEDVKDDLIQIPYAPEAYVIELPDHFPRMQIPSDNPMTKQGVKLGRFLFYDPILSGDSTMSCASCHLPELGFTDGKKVSTGIDNVPGTRSSMSLINIGFAQAGLFWDGRVKTLEEQALLPVEDDIELHHTWPEVIEKLKKHPIYPKMFREAFGIKSNAEISKELAAKAIAQFERTIISKDSKFDKVQEGKAKYTNLELIGFGIYFDDDPDLPDAECGHCHNVPMGTSDDYFNNGLFNAANLDDFKDLGRGKVTGSKSDNGKFRATTLRNIKYTAPYMHDGSLATLDDVLAHYVKSDKKSPTKDKLLHPLDLDEFYLTALKAFIETLNDTTFYNNPELKNPFK